MFDVSCLHFVVSIIVRLEDTCHLFHDLIANDCYSGEVKMMMNNIEMIIRAMDLQMSISVPLYRGNQRYLIPS